MAGMDFEEDDLGDYEDANDGDVAGKSAPRQAGVKAESEAEDESPSETGAETSTKGKKTPDSALAAMRRRTQEAERKAAEKEQELAYLKGRLEAAVPGNSNEGQAPEWDFTDMAASAAKVAEHVTSAKERARLAAEESEFRELLNSSIADAREEHDDFEEVAARFVARQNADPGLAKRVRRAADPAEWAYQNQKRHEERAAKGNPEVEKLRKRIEELEADRGGEAAPKHRSLANARGANASTTKRTGATYGDANADFSDTFRRSS